MAIPLKEHSEAITSGLMESNSASVELTPEMFEMLSAGVYQNPKLAIVRELLCNARDAQVEAGNSDTPIRVTLPNAFKPNLVFRDFGTGLSHERIMNMYLTYGASTKKGTNSAIGEKGIGSKSPLSYTDSFLVISYYNGTKTTYNIHKNKGIPQVTKLAEENTSEENGLEISIAIKQEDHYIFKANVSKFLFAFNFPVKVVGDYEPSTVAYTIETDLYKVVEYNYNVPVESGCYALMGGVLYDLSKEVTSQIKEVVAGSIIFLPFKIGSLSTAASREALSMDDPTTKALEERIVEVKDKYYGDRANAISKHQYLVDVIDDLEENYDLKRTSYYSEGTNLEELEWNSKTIKEWREYLQTSPVCDATEVKVIRSTKKPVYLNLTCRLSPICISGYFIDNMGELTILYVDGKKSGHVKYATEYSKQKLDGGRVLVVQDKATADTIKDYYQEVFKKITVVSIADDYLNMFPKGTKTSVKVSGAFVYKNGNKRAVNEITVESGEKAYYLPLHRDKVVINGEISEKQLSSYYWLVDMGVIDELYLIRKSAKKSLLKDLTDITEWDTIQPLVNDLMPMTEYEEIATARYYDTKSNRFSNMKYRASVFGLEVVDSELTKIQTLSDKYNSVDDDKADLVGYLMHIEGSAYERFWDDLVDTKSATVTAKIVEVDKVLSEAVRVMKWDHQFGDYKDIIKETIKKELLKNKALKAK